MRNSKPTRPAWLAMPSILAVLSAAPAGAEPVFTRQIDLDDPVSVVEAADLDGDGHLDLVATGGQEVLHVLLGRGDGTYESDLEVPTLSRSKSAVVVDLDADGALDVVVGGQYGNVGVLLGNGDGSFEGEVSYPTGGTGVSVAVGDLNGDGVLDVIGGRWTDTNDPFPSVRVFLGVGDGTLVPQAPFTPERGLTALALADLDGDGALDLVSCHQHTDQLRVHPGKGDGTFHPAIAYPTVGYPFALDVADVDGDADLDVVVVSWTSAAGVVLHPGQPDGALEPFVSLPSYGGSQEIQVADADVDGHADVVSVTRGGRALVLRGVGGGAFAPNQNYRAGDNTRGFAIADLNADGIPDLAVSDLAGRGLSLMLGEAGGRYHAPFEIFTDHPRIGPDTFDAGDLDGDGMQDLVVPHGRDATVDVLWGLPDGRFAAPTTLAAGRTAEDAVVADVTHDGIPDIIFIDSRDGNVGVLAGNGDRTFEPAASYPAGSGPGTMTVADFDGDGILDVAVGGGVDEIRVLLGTGGGAFDAPIPHVVGAHPIDLQAADLDGDRLSDLVVLDWEDDDLGILLGNGDGTFRDGAPIPTAGVHAYLGLADVDEDGAIDVITDTFDPKGGDAIAVHHGLGDGSFEPPVVSYPGCTTQTKPSTGCASTGIYFQGYSVAVADFDLDGHRDLIVTSWINGPTALVRGAGGRTFAEPELLFTGVGDAPVALARDFDGDGLIDVAFGNDDGRIVVALNLGDDPLRVGIDVWPRRDRNLIRPGSAQRVPVSVLGSEALDVGDIDVATLGFGPDAAPAGFRFVWDENRDGFDDLIAYYRARDTGIAVGDTEACVTGALEDATPFSGCDEIETVPGCGFGFGASAALLPAVLWRRRRRRNAPV